MTETRKRERENNFMVLDDEDDDIVEFSKRKQPTFPALAEFLESNHSKKPRIDESSQIYSNQSSIAIDRRTTLANTTPGDEIFSMQEDLQYPDSPKAAPTTHSTNRKPIDTNNSEEVVRELSLIDGEEDNVPSLSAYYEEQVKNRAQSSLAASLEIEPLDLLSEFGSTSASVTRQPLFSTQSKQTHNYSRPPVSGSYITANCPLTGKILYLPRIQKSKQKSDVVNKIKRGSLLAKPVTLMTKEIEAAERERKLREENERRILEKRRKKKHNKAKTEQLWVEKYKPRAFIDLLGDQRVNREVLKWIKEWDYCVFGKMPPAESDREKAMRRYKSVFGNGAASRRVEMNDKPKDRLLRPEKKILLLSGPPGFGKTTLAHVAAAHAGYNIIEINASDDRTGEAVKSKVKAALEMQAIVKHTDTGKDGKEDVKMQQKPNFLIIDEIDGASSSGGSDSFIKQLVQLATADIPNEDERDGTNRKGKGKRAAPLLRPIICICNDAYAPVLRPLRAVAQHIQFRKVPILTIGKRLQEICEEEDLETDLRTLCVLAESTDGDIRSCLHTLQFIRGKSDTFSREMLKEAGLGQKDTAKSLFAIWEELFCAIDARNFSSMQTMDSKQRYLNRLLQTISSSGEHERIMQGCFEAYLNMRFNDVAGKKIVMMSDWLDFYDHLNYRANELHDYSVYGYLPFPIINFHRFFAASVIQDHRVEYPRVEYEKFVSKRSHENLVNVFLEGINPAQRRALHKDIVVTELIPRLLRIISPDLRPVNKQLIKPAEVAVLSRVVEIMIEFGLTFIQDINEDGQFVYKLEPPIDQIMNFEAFGIKSVLTNKYAVRQLVSQEIEAEILRRREAALEAKGANASIKAKNAITIQETIKQASKEAIKPQVAKDFFGRPIQPDAAPRRNKQVEVSKVPVAYRYHEGFSNAVRKPMTVSMFL